MRRKVAQFLVMLLIFQLAIPWLDSIEVSAQNNVTPTNYDIPHYDDGMNINENFEVGNATFLRVFPPNYTYESKWRVEIRDPDGNVIDNSAGLMGFMRPVADKDYTLGRTFIHKSTLSRWVEAFNGNWEWVGQTDSNGNYKNINFSYFKRESDGKIFARFHSQEIGRVTGANVVQLKDDKGVNYVEATLTRWPNITKLNVPTETNVGKETFISFDGVVEYPYPVRSGEYLQYELYVNGQVIKTGKIKGKQAKQQKISFIPNEEGTQTVKLKILDPAYRYDEAVRTITVGPGTPVEGGEEDENIPPVAAVSAESFAYWPETLNISTVAYDEDGEVISEELYVDGQLSSNKYQSARVTEKTPHIVDFVVTDDAGDTAEASTTFEIWPTIPKAETEVQGELKQNRAIVLDAKASDRVSPVHVAPIQYELSKWSVTPITEGLTLADIKERPSSDPSKKQLLFKKPGQYEVKLTVTNIYGEESEVHTRILDIRPDEVPYSRFTVDQSVYLRDKADGKQATITLRDQSVSLDGDTIGQRIWYVEFDANNDGIFGTAADGGKQVISSKNETVVEYKTDHVGHYRFSLEVTEKFGEPTYEEFIEPQEYLRDVSDKVDEDDSVVEYMKVENFNLPNFDKGIKVDNVPPIIDFGVKRMNSIEVVLDFGGMDQATLQHKTGSRPGAGINNGGGGGTYNHYYYTIDEQYKNKLAAYASDLESDLRMKGLDAKVTLNNCYYHVLDLDGECVTNVPVWGWRDHGSYTYSSYSGTSPYSGDWEVVSQTSTPIYEVTWCYFRYWYESPKHPDGGYWVEHSHPPPCTKDSNAVYEQTGTRYDAVIRKWVPDWRFEVTGYTNEGCGPDNRPGNPTTDPAGIDEKIDTTDFSQDFSNFAYSNATYKYYFRMDRNPWTWNNNTTKKNLVINKIKNDQIYFWSNADNGLRTMAQSLINNSGEQGAYTQYSTDYLQSNIQRLKDHLLNRFMIEENAESFTIVLGDQLDYTTVYNDFENDPEYKREWKFVHDPTSVNGRVIDNQPNGPIAQSGLYINEPMQLTEVGTYTVTLRAQDNPLSDVGNDARFADYRKWSDQETVREYKINVHRRPIADFTFSIQPGTLSLSLDPSPSYDPDHQYNRADKGIVEYTWEKYVVDGVEYNGEPPSTLEPFKDYHITLRVKDIDGAYGYTTKLVSTKNVNLKPVALFDAPSVTLVNSPLNIIDRSYDPNGDRLTNYQITVKRASDGVIVWSGSTFPNSFGSMGLGVGKYIMGLTVEDIPQFPPSLRSDLYEKMIEVIDNRPPNSCFELSRTPITAASITCVDDMTSPYTLYVDEPAIYTDKSSDPDGHELINYSWRIEKLNDQNEVIGIWNTGSPPIDFSDYGVGKYRVTQIVFDNPPSPLPSLSGEISKIYNVIKGPQAPYAMFDHSPLLPIAGQTIQLTDHSWDEDGNITQWQWTIEAPNGTVTTQTTRNPVISNALEGKYKVTLHVWDNNLPTKLRSKVPAYKEILVAPKPPNIPPVPLFTWAPFKPYLGDTVILDGDASYDLDGTIVSYSWEVRSKEGGIQTFTGVKPSFVANSEYYDVKLTVRDDKGATANVTQRIMVNIAKLTPLVTHTDAWKDYWVEQGFDEDVNTFLAGETFIIRLFTTPANRVEGKLNLGGDFGTIQIDSDKFNLVSTSQYQYVWETTLWREDFEEIPEGEYLFEFKGYHPVNSPYVVSDGKYLVEIKGNIYSPLNFHRNY